APKPIVESSRTSIHFVQAFGQLDKSTPRSGEKCDGDAKGRYLAVRPGQLHALGFKILRERLEVLHLEADVIERPPLRPDDRGLRRREVHHEAGQSGTDKSCRVR